MTCTPPFHRAGDSCTRRTCPPGTWTLDPGEGTCSRPNGPDPDKNPQSCPATELPVGIGTGGKRFTETDLALTGTSPLQWTRRYNSQIIRTRSALSPQWLHSYSRWIETVGATSAYLLRADGRMVTAQLVDTTTTSGRQRWTVDSTETEQLYRSFEATTPTGWIVIDTHNSIERYDTLGRLTEITQSNGVTQTLTYSAATSTQPLGQLTRITDHSGRSLNLAYDAQAHLSALTDAQGRIYRYTYNANGQLAAVQYPDTTQRQYLYNEADLTGGANLPQAITGLMDEANYRLGRYRYDSTGRAVQSQWVNTDGFVGGATLSYSGAVTTVTNALGAAHTYSFVNRSGRVLLAQQSQPGGAGCGPASSAITYDGQTNVESRTDFNNTKTCYAYDLARNLETRRLEGLPGAAVCAASLTNPPADARLVTTQWHPDWRLETRRAEPRLITTWVYNGQGASCAPANALVDGKPIAVVCRRTEQATSDDTGAAGFAAAPSGPARTSTFTYNRWGQVLTSNGPRGDASDTIAYDYYPDTQPNWTQGDLRQTTNAAGHVTRFTRYNRHGQVLERVEANGLTTQYSYDLRQRLTRTQVGDEVSTYDYDPVGNLIKVSLPEGGNLTYTYDPAHRLTQITDHKGNRVVYTLDAMGNRTAEKTTDASGALLRNITRVMDALNRVQRVVGGE